MTALAMISPRSAAPRSVLFAWAMPYSLAPARPGDPGVGRTTGLASGTEPVVAVAPGDYEAVPLEADGVVGSSGSGTSWRALALGAGAGAAAAALVARRRSARSRG